MFLERIKRKDIINHLDTYTLPLFVSGARQVGKTTLIMKVLEEYDYVYINLFENQRFNNIFDKNKDLDYNTIIQSLEEITLRKITEDTIIYIDEIQVNEVAFSALKTFNEAKKCRVVVSGSNVAPTLFSGNKYAYPVGQFLNIELYVMSFSEFLLATNNEFLLEKIIEGLSNKKPSQTIHDKAFELFDTYLRVGGMPNVLKSYVQDLSIAQISVLQDQLYDNYVNDFAKYAKDKDIKYLKSIYQQIPSVLKKENQLFKSSFTGFRAEYLEESYEWLRLSRMVTFCNRIRSTTLPLSSNIKRNKFKIFLNDTGLLVNYLDYSVIDHNKQADKIYLGEICENYIASVLIKYNKDIYYYDDGKIEIDFICSANQNLIALEVKASHNTKSKALNSFINKHNPKYYYKLSRRMLNAEEHQLPLYSLDIIYENKINGYGLISENKI